MCIHLDVISQVHTNVCTKIVLYLFICLFICLSPLITCSRAHLEMWFLGGGGESGILMDLGGGGAMYLYTPHARGV